MEPAAGKMEHLTSETSGQTRMARRDRGVRGIMLRRAVQRRLCFCCSCTMFLILQFTVKIQKQEPLSQPSTVVDKEDFSTHLPRHAAS